MKKNNIIDRFPIAFFILLTFLISHLLNPIIVELVHMAFPDFKFSFPMSGLNNRSLVAQYGPTIAAIILVLRLYGTKGLKSTLRYSAPKISDLKWLMVSLIIPLSMILLSYRLAGVALHELAEILLGHWELYLLVIGGHIIASGLAEEYGWRGFMLPQLLNGRSPLMVAFLIYIIVCLWHFPALLAGWKNEPILPFLIIVLPITIIHCWLFFQSNGSLLAPIIFHAAFDAQYSFVSNFVSGDNLLNRPFHQGWTYITLYCLFALTIIILTKGSLGYDSLRFKTSDYFGTSGITTASF